MTTRLCDLPYDVIGENILARVPLTCLKAVRYTCKLLNALSKEFIVGKATTRQHKFLGFMNMDYKVCSLRFNLQGIRKDEDLVSQSIKQFDLPNQFEIREVICYEGLVLCANKDVSKLVVWNPYLGQTRWIRPRDPREHGYGVSKNYVIGYDNNCNHKMLTVLSDARFEIYDFSCGSWRFLDIMTPDCEIKYDQHSVTLKGNAYFFATVKVTKNNAWGYDVVKLKGFLICFDFTRERFGKRLALPFKSITDSMVTLSCVREEQLAVLHENWDGSCIWEIWVTTKIDLNEVSWSKFFAVSMKPLDDFLTYRETGCFFIDEEKKVAVVFDLDRYNQSKPIAYIIGEDGYFKSVKLQKRMSKNFDLYLARVSSCYLPNLVQIEKPRKQKRKRKTNGRTLKEKQLGHVKSPPKRRWRNAI